MCHGEREECGGPPNEAERLSARRLLAEPPDGSVAVLIAVTGTDTVAVDPETGKLVLASDLDPSACLRAAEAATLDFSACAARTTAVVITHNAAIAGMADRVMHLGDGRIQRLERQAHKLTPSELSW